MKKIIYFSRGAFFVLSMCLVILLTCCDNKEANSSNVKKNRMNVTQKNFGVSQKNLEKAKAQKWLKTIKGKWKIVRYGFLNSPGTIGGKEAKMALNKILRISDTDVYFPCHDKHICYIIFNAQVALDDSVYDRCAISNYTEFKEMTIEKYFEIMSGHPPTGYRDAGVGKSVKPNDKVIIISAKNCTAHFADTIVILPNHELMYETGAAFFYMKKIH